MASLAASGHCVALPIQREFGSGTKFCNGDALLPRLISGQLRLPEAQELAAEAGA